MRSLQTGAMNNQPKVDRSSLVSHNSLLMLSTENGTSRMAARVSKHSFQNGIQKYEHCYLVVQISVAIFLRSLTYPKSI